MNLTITIHGTGTEFVFDVPKITELTIGRLDPDTGVSVDIDLHEYDAEERVSRQHAAIRRRGDTLYLVDLGSANGTFVSELQLFPQKPRVLRDGDTIRVGRLLLQVTLK